MAYRKPTGRITLRIITHNKKPGSTAEMWVVGHLDPDGEKSSGTLWWGSEPRARRDRSGSESDSEHRALWPIRIHCLFYRRGTFSGAAF